MKITSDWHIHSRNSCDQAAMAIEDLILEAEAKGIKDFGITDHLFTPHNLPDLSKSRAEYDQCNPSPRFHFGVEASSVSRWELDQLAADPHCVPNPAYGIRSGGPSDTVPAIGIAREELAALGAEYVVAGTHFPLYVEIERQTVIRDYHRQNIFLATHQLVDIVAHPWWWHKHWQNDDGTFTGKPWFDDFRHIPQSMHDEFAAALVETDTKAEINLGATLLNPHYPDRFKEQYLEYIADLKAKGVQLCTSSDCHAEHYTVDLEAGAAMLDRIGITEDDLWRLPPRQ